MEDDTALLSEEQLLAFAALEEDATGKVHMSDAMRAEVLAYEAQARTWRSAPNAARQFDEDEDVDDAPGGAAESGKTAKPKGTRKKLKPAKDSAAARKKVTEGKENTPQKQAKQDSAGGAVTAQQAVPVVLSNPTRALRRTMPFTFTTLINNVLSPEDVAGGEDSIADALLLAKHIRLESLALSDSTILECLSAATHCYLQHNRLTEINGLETMMFLTTAVFHHNAVESLEPLASLQHLTFIDASFNNISQLDAERHLPFMSLKSLNLIGNPCAPDYDVLRGGVGDAVAEQQEYRDTYTAEILSHCTALATLDGEVVEKAQTQTLRAMLEHSHEFGVIGTDDFQDGADGGSQFTGCDDMQTRFKDSDFMEDGNTARDLLDDDDDEEVATPVDALRMRTPLGDGSSDDGKNNAAVAPKTKKTKKGAANAKAARAGGSPSGAVAPLGEYVHTITSQLLQRYEKEMKKKEVAVVMAVDSANTFDDVDLTDKVDDNVVGAGAAAVPALAGHASYVEASKTQHTLRSELRFAQNHYSQLAIQQVETSWDGAHDQIQKRQDAATHRRARLMEALAKPSAAYTSALALLESESGGKGLEHYRQLQPAQTPTPAALPTPS